MILYRQVFKYFYTSKLCTSVNMWMFWESAWKRQLRWPTHTLCVQCTDVRHMVPCNLIEKYQHFGWRFKTCGIFCHSYLCSSQWFKGLKCLRVQVLPDLVDDDIVIFWNMGTTVQMTAVLHTRSLESLARYLQETKTLHFTGSCCCHLCGTC